MKRWETNECKRYMRQWRLRNVDKMRSYKLRWYHANKHKPETPEQIAAHRARSSRYYYLHGRNKPLTQDQRNVRRVRCKEWHAKQKGKPNPARIHKHREASRRWFHRNKDKYRAKSIANGRRSYARNIERLRAKARERYHCDPQRMRIAAHNRRALGVITADIWNSCLAAHGHKCAYCASTVKLECDHKLPVSRGGTNATENLQPACRHCNRMKNKKTHEEFIAYLAIVSHG